jgi:(R,R)-butanediol dehydrogenase/meso-butanediol dehydrogenase/diacetyl reductase
MRALRWHGRLDVRVDEVEPPGPPAAADAQVRVLSCGICGTDTEEFKEGPLFIPTQPHPLTGRAPPITLGHEVCGEVVAAGPAADQSLVGRLVAVDGIISCGTCWACKEHRVNLCAQLASIGFSADGGLAPLLNAPARGCIPLREDIAAEVGVLAEPLAVAVRALRRGRFVRGERVAVVGGGAVGQLAAQASLALGAREVVLAEPDPARRASAADAGVPVVVHPGEVGDVGADVVVECSGSPGGVATSISAARATGRVVLLGIAPYSPPLPVLRLVRHEQEIIGSLSHVYDEDFAAAVDLINDGEVGQRLHRVKVGLEEALGYLTGRTALPAGAVKVVVCPGAGSSTSD